MSLVQTGWLDVSQIVATKLNGSANEYWAVLSDSINNHIGRKGIVKGAKIQLIKGTIDKGGNISGLGIGIWRKIEKNKYKLLGKSQEITSNVSNGIKTILFDEADYVYDVQSDDLIGYIIKPTDITQFIYYYKAVDNVIDDSAVAKLRWYDPNSASYDSFVIGNEYTMNGGGAIFGVVPIYALMDSPRVMIVGDSISEGAPLNITYRRDDGGSNNKNKKGSYLQVACDILGFSCENGGNTQTSNNFSEVLNNDLTSVLWDKNSQEIWIHCGVNDICDGRSWNNVESNLNDILVECTNNGAIMVLFSIFPWRGNILNTTGTHEQNVKREWWNNKIKNWARLKDVLFVNIKDNVLGTERLIAKTGDPDPILGNKWDLISDYDIGDGLGVHLSELGASVAGAAAAIGYFDIDEYSISYGGGKWYYTQNKPGTKWYDTVDNKKGWTIDFNMRLISVENNWDVLSDIEPPNGLGIYINDGIAQESIYFLPQEICFTNSEKKIIFDTTQKVDYRIIGKENNLKLYGKNDKEVSYSLLAETDFITNASNEGNGLKPKIAVDVNGDIHVVWYDDGNRSGQLYYSKYSNNEWSSPELIVNSKFGISFPDIVVDGNGIIYIVFQTNETDKTDINFIYYDVINGWSDIIPINVGNGFSNFPRIILDNQENVHVVWEDNRFEIFNIFYSKWDKISLKWNDLRQLSNSNYGAFRPSITSYLDDIFVSWTENKNGNYSIIKVISYNSFTGKFSSIKIVSNNTGDEHADYSDILANVKGNIFVVWHDHKKDRYDIYTRILLPDLSYFSDIIKLTTSNGGAKFPVLSENIDTGDIFYVWEDFLEEFIPLNTGDPYIFDIFGNKTIFVAVYNLLRNEFLESCPDENTHIKILFVEESNISFVAFDQRNISFPAIPDFFNNNLPIVYESLLRKDDGFFYNRDRFSEIRHTFFNFNIDDPTGKISPCIFEASIDLKINGKENRKEIRFGDFSNNLNLHVIFGEFNFYTKDAVEPLSITEISQNTLSMKDLVVMDAVVSNYGDAWLVGPCGMLFFMKEQNSIYLIGESEDDNIFGPDKPIRIICFDQNNNLYVGGNFGIYYSVNHFNNFIKMENIDEDVTALIFDKNNRIFIGTSNNGIKIGTIQQVNNNGEVNLNIDIDSIVSLSSQLPNLFITSIAVDDNNIIWIGTKNGLVRYYNGNIFTFDKSHGLASSLINDIAIRNTAIRYIATSNGISKMTGTLFSTLTSQDSKIWNDNVKSIIWRDPNILWAGTLSSLNQIIVDDEEGTYDNVIFLQNEYSSFNDNFNDLKTFYIITDGQEIEKDCHVEVFLNGNRISHGFTVSFFPYGIIRFDTKLKSQDVVDVVIRDNIKVLSSFFQTSKEKNFLGVNVIKVKNIDTLDDNVFVVTYMDENEIKVNDGKTKIPFDKIHFDQTPPTGMIRIADQIHGGIVRVNITNVSDISSDGITAGSGVNKMIISNYSNFTFDGQMKQNSIDLVSTLTHDLGFIGGNIVDIISFTNGRGSVISFFSDNNDLFSATSNTAVLYQYSFIDQSWESKFVFKDEMYIDFITKYNNKLVIGISNDIEIGKLYIFDIINREINYNSYSIFNFDESRVFAYQELDNILYIGTGIGDGNEYADGIGNGGAIWSFNGDTLNLIINGLDSNVKDIANVNNRLIAVTDNKGFVYEISPLDKISFIIHTDNDSLSSVDSVTFKEKECLFVGSKTTAKILRSNVDSFSFFFSFQTVPGEVSILKTFIDSDENEILYAVIDNVIYYLSVYGTWTWKYTHNEKINDITFDNRDGTLYVISDEKITKIESLDQTKTVYLQLIDRAGNKSELFDKDGNLNTNLSDSISISTLIGFVNENKILELDENGDIVFTLSGNNNFYSANKIEEEKGEYFSEIFNGTNELIKWDIFSWQATELIYTKVLTYIRSSNSKNDILTEDWIGPFYINQASGVDISFIQGQFLQFKVELISYQKNISPLFHRASIRVVIGEAVHFFTSNFLLPGKIRKGILTSEKLIPVSADIIFALNSTNSVDFTDYQIIDENRLFNINQNGENLRVGIKFISPSRSLIEPIEISEYGPYNSLLYTNTIDFDFTNTTGSSHNYFFVISLYEDIGLNNCVYKVSSEENQDGFNINGAIASATGINLASGENISVFFVIPGSANIGCNLFYFVKIEYFYYNGEEQIINILSDYYSFISTCTTTFIDDIKFDFTNNSDSSNNYHFRIKFFEDPERTNEFLTLYSGNNISGWKINGKTIPDDGFNVGVGEVVTVFLSIDNELFESQKIYYLIIDAFDGNEFIFRSNSFTFQARDITSLVYCGEYMDVPIVNNFGLMFELDNKEHVGLNLIGPSLDIS